MPARKVKLWLIGLFVACFAVAIVGAALRGQPIFTPFGLAGLIGAALALILMSGLIPVIWWAVRSFRLSSARRVLILWTVLLGVLSLLNLLSKFYETGQIS